MPKVPTYDGLTVADTPLPGARSGSIASPALLGGAADNMIATGQSLTSVGNDLTQIAEKMQDRRNADVLLRTESAFKDALTEFDTVQRSKKGAAVLADGGITEQTSKWFGDAVRKHSDLLENDEQRRVFNEISTKLRTQTLSSVSVHQANESRSSLTDSTKASIVSSINRAAANANDWTIAETERGEISRRVDMLAQINGYTPEVRAVVLGENLTMLHSQMIQQLVKTNPAAVEGYYKKYEGEIDGSKRAELGEFARKATSTSLGDGTAEAIWQANRPRNGTEPLRLADMEDAARAALKGNDDAIEKALKGIKERASSYEFQKKQEGNALEASVNGLILKGASGAAVRSSPEFLKLSVQAPEDARKVMTFLENQEYTKIVRADAADARRERRLHKDTLTTALRLSDPDMLVALSRDEVVNLLPKLGVSSTTALLNRWDSLTKSGDKLLEARMDKQDFDAIALSAGLRPNEKNKSEDEKDGLLRLQQRVESVIDSEQRARGNRPLSREEKQKIMQREVDNKVMDYVPFWFDRPAVYNTLAPGDKRSAFVRVDGKDVRIASIPDDFTRAAIKARRERGLDTSEKQLAELWARRVKGATDPWEPTKRFSLNLFGHTVDHMPVK